jgi:two-component system NarL family response regulator
MPAKERIKVGIVEDNVAAGRSLVKLLESDHDFALVSWFRKAEDALETLPGKNIDILIVDIGLPGMDGLNLIREIKDIMPDIRPVVYTIFEDEQKLIQAIQFGAKGYILKDTPPDLFLAELKVIMLGGAPLTPRIAEKIISLFPKREETPVIDTVLSERETEIINQVALGLRYGDIAEELNISVHTVRRHIENIYQKLDVHNKSEALRKCRKEGLIGT